MIGRLNTLRERIRETHFPPKGALADILCLKRAFIDDVIIPVKCFRYKNHSGKHKVTQGFDRLTITYEWEDGPYDQMH